MRIAVLSARKAVDLFDLAYVDQAPPSFLLRYIKHHPLPTSPPPHDLVSAPGGPGTSRARTSPASPSTVGSERPHHRCVLLLPIRAPDGSHSNQARLAAGGCGAPPHAAGPPGVPHTVHGTPTRGPTAVAQTLPELHAVNNAQQEAPAEQRTESMCSHDSEEEQVAPDSRLVVPALRNLMDTRQRSASWPDGSTRLGLGPAVTS
jgi:hypothetical protein